MAIDDDINGPYLPERYKQKIREKQQRRRIRKILTAAAGIAVIGIILWILVSSSGSTPRATPGAPATTPKTTSNAAMTSVAVSPTFAVTTPVTSSTLPASPAITTSAGAAGPVSTAGYMIEPGVPVTGTGGSLSLADAVAALRGYYPEQDYGISTVNFTSGISRSLFGFTIRPVSATAPTAGTVVFIDAATGKPWGADQEKAAFPQEKVRGVITSLFPDAGDGTIKSWYHNDPVKGGVWMFRSASGNLTLLAGSLDASTGRLLSFTRNIPQSDRPRDPAISQQKAQSIASNYVRDQTGGTFSLNLTDSGYETWGTASVPAAGQYFFTWQRLYNNYPVDTDRISAAVDAVSGDVIAYDRQLTTPDFAFSQVPEQAVMQRDATFAVMNAARQVYPASVESIGIVSAEIRWRNAHVPGASQRPGSVPLAWKIVFDDAVIRADPALLPGVAWIDLQTGNVTSMEYRH